MRGMILVALAVLMPKGAVAQEAARDCDAQAALVMAAVNARVEGDSKGKTRRGLRTDLGRTAGDMLADWIWDLPEDLLTAEVGETWKAQCEAL